MTKAEYNTLINVCKSEKCFDCGAKSQCNVLEDVGIKLLEVQYWKQLSESEKKTVQSV
jgi:hypothetical protein